MTRLERLFYRGLAVCVRPRMLVRLGVGWFLAMFLVMPHSPDMDRVTTDSDIALYLAGNVVIFFPLLMLVLVGIHLLDRP